MTNLVLTRHGETAWHQENRYAGSSDVALNAVGRAQALRLADWAVRADLVACWSSDLSRARDTLAPVAAATGLPARHDEGLRELDFGAGEGLTAAEMEACFGPGWAAFLDDPVAHHLPGGEDPHEAIRRAMGVIDEIRAAHPVGRVLIVWHSTLLRLTLCHLLGLPVSGYRRVFPYIRNGGVSEIRLDGGTPALLEFNTPLELVRNPAK